MQELAVCLFLMVAGVVTVADDQRWSAAIPLDVLERILQRLASITDCIRFGAVCKLWQAILVESQPRLNPFPLVLLPPPGASPDDCPTDRELLDLDITANTSRTYKLPSVFDSQKHSIVGSSYGWLATMVYSTPSKHEMQLFNPITRAHIPLPPATTFANFHLVVEDRDDDEYCFNWPLWTFNAKVLLFTETDSKGVVMAIHGHRRHLGFCRVGDERWTSFPATEQFDHYHDVIYHKGQFYAVTQCSSVVACVLDPVPEVIEIARIPPSRDVEQKYLVESTSGELLMVTKYTEEEGLRTAFFAADKLDMATGEWKEVTSLDGCVMFLGNCRSVMLPAEEAQGCRPNTIYFLDDTWQWRGERGCSECGAYDWEKEEIEMLYIPSQPWQLPLFWISGAW